MSSFVDPGYHVTRVLSEADIGGHVDLGLHSIVDDDSRQRIACSTKVAAVSVHSVAMLIEVVDPDECPGFCSATCSNVRDVGQLARRNVRVLANFASLR